MSPSIHHPDLDDGRTPIVVVPDRPPGLRAIVAGMAAVLALAALLWYATGSLVVAAGQVVAGVLLLSTFVGARAVRSMPPALAVFEDGIQLSSDRPAPGEDASGPGFLAWDEVRHCRWSPHDPGRLCVFLVNAGEPADPLGPDDPPGALAFDVPGPYREAVEAALRERGRWVD